MFVCISKGKEKQHIIWIRDTNKPKVEEEEENNENERGEVKERERGGRGREIVGKREWERESGKGKRERERERERFLPPRHLAASSSGARHCTSREGIANSTPLL